MMTILVTGATGCLGRHVAHGLKGAGYDVRASGRKVSIGQELLRSGVLFQPADLSDVSSLDELVGGCDAVVHCAALSSTWGKYEDFFRANVSATQHLLEAGLRQKIKRFVHISSTSVYFNGRDRCGLTEEDVVASPMVNAYARTKYQAELKVADAAKQGLQTIILRPRAIFGAYDQNLFPRLLRAVKSGFLPLPAGGTALIDVTYVENVVEAVRRALQSGPETLGKIYNITNGEPRSVRSILEELFLSTGQKTRLVSVPACLLSAVAVGAEAFAQLFNAGEPALTRYGVSLLSTSQTFDLKAARQDLRYQPAVSISAGIDRFAAWWRALP